MAGLLEVELRRQMIVQEERRRVRARHSRLATIELNTSIPRLLAKFDAEVQAGNLPDLSDFFPGTDAPVDG